jgi:hypothetical protein
MLTVIDKEEICFNEMKLIFDAYLKHIKVSNFYSNAKHIHSVTHMALLDIR